jgi:hypothetical protein
MVANDINKMIPSPKVAKVPESYHGMPWWKAVWKYIVTSTEWELLEDWKITLPGGLQAMVRKGTVVNGASIPKFFRFLATPTGPLWRASVLHDPGYRDGFLLDWDGRPFAICKGQKFHDQLFRDITIYTTGAKWVAYGAYRALRMFGWKAWNGYREAENNVR